MIQHYVIKFVRSVVFSGYSTVSSTNKTNCHDIAKILLKVVLSNISLLTCCDSNDNVWFDLHYGCDSSDNVWFDLHDSCDSSDNVWFDLHDSCDSSDNVWFDLHDGCDSSNNVWFDLHDGCYSIVIRSTRYIV